MIRLACAARLWHAQVGQCSDFLGSILCNQASAHALAHANPQSAQHTHRTQHTIRKRMSTAFFWPIRCTRFSACGCIAAQPMEKIREPAQPMHSLGVMHSPRVPLPCQVQGGHGRRAQHAQHAIKTHLEHIAWRPVQLGEEHCGGGGEGVACVGHHDVEQGDLGGEVCGDS